MYIIYRKFYLLFYPITEDKIKDLLPYAYIYNLDEKEIRQ